MIGSLEQMRCDFENGVFDYTDNGRCVECGKCCSNYLFLSEREIQRIKAYIKRNGIKQSKLNAPFANPMAYATCPFMNHGKKNHKCNIYPVRPEICKCFICSEPNGAREHDELYSEPRRMVHMDEVFYGSE